MSRPVAEQSLVGVLGRVCHKVPVCHLYMQSIGSEHDNTSTSVLHSVNCFTALRHAVKSLR